MFCEPRGEVNDLAASWKPATLFPSAQKTQARSIAAPPRCGAQCSTEKRKKKKKSLSPFCLLGRFSRTKQPENVRLLFLLGEAALDSSAAQKLEDSTLRSCPHPPSSPIPRSVQAALTRLRPAQRPGTASACHSH